MRKLLSVIFAGFAVVASSNVARANDALTHDTSDPLYLQHTEEILSKSSLTFWNHTLRFGQSLSYGLNNRLTVGANVNIQEDFRDDEDGFSAIDIGGIYRMGRAEDSNSGMISDVLFGLKFGGSSHVRTPYFADSTYYAGLRFGRQWAGLTLATTLQSNWIFDDQRGMAFIDVTPEAYFRINPDWRVGANFVWRKSTNPHYDQEWLGGKIVRQYGRTQYIGHLDYEFESDEIQVGARLNILF